MDLLSKVLFLEQDASEFGFAWETTAQIMEQIQSECREIDEHLGENRSSADLQEEIGDLLHAVFSLCVFCQFDPKITLQNTLQKFEKRLNSVKAIAHEKDLSTLKELPFQELMRIWQEAKKRVG